MLLKIEPVKIQNESNTNDKTIKDTKLPEFKSKKNFVEEGMTKDDIT